MHEVKGPASIFPSTWVIAFIAGIVIEDDHPGGAGCLFYQLLHLRVVDRLDFFIVIEIGHRGDLLTQLETLALERWRRSSSRAL